MPLPPFDIEQEATGLTNELFYRNGSALEPLMLSDVTIVRETIERGLCEAYEAGKNAR